MSEDAGKIEVTEEELALKIGELREKIEADKKLKGYRKDDEFLNRFLYCAKMDVAKSLKRYKVYYDCISGIPGIEPILCGQLDSVLATMEQLAKDPPFRLDGFDHRGRAVVAIQSSKINTSLPNALLSMLLLNIGVIDAILERYPNARKNGFVMVVDHSGLSMGHYKMLIGNLSTQRALMKFLNGGFPIRITHIWVCKESKVFGLIFKLFKMALSRKMVDRIDVVGMEHEQVKSYLGGSEFMPAFLDGGESAPIADVDPDTGIEDRLRKALPFYTT